MFGKKQMYQKAFGDYLVLFSYQTAVARYNARKAKIEVTERRWSKTTSRHIGAWLQTLPDIRPSYISQEYFNQLAQDMGLPQSTFAGESFSLGA